SDVEATDKDGNKIPRDKLKVDPGQLDDINKAIKDNREGDFPLTFTTDDGTSVTITVHVSKLIEYNVTVRYHSFTADGKVITTVVLAKTYHRGDTVSVTSALLNAQRSKGFGAGVAVQPVWTVSSDRAANVFDVYYPDTAPVISVKTNVLYVRQPVRLTVADILRLAGVTVTDAEESIPLSQIVVTGYSGIKWNVVNYPSGIGYTITLSVKDTPGLDSPVHQIAIFIESRSEKVRPATAKERAKLPNAPKGTAWGVDEDGNYVLCESKSLRDVITDLVGPGSGLGLPGTGDALMVLTPLALLAVALFIVFKRLRRRPAPNTGD
ncbi:MAG: hypothetical protein FWD65_05545, partial [Coriobacteriia bacterium]|nr:hypothetical protein [Coriobacteriia bacterium]